MILTLCCLNVMACNYDKMLHLEGETFDMKIGQNCKFELCCVSHRPSVLCYCCLGVCQAKQHFIYIYWIFTTCLLCSGLERKCLSKCEQTVLFIVGQ